MRAIVRFLPLPGLGHDVFAQAFGVSPEVFNSLATDIGIPVRLSVFPQKIACILQPTVVAVAYDADAKIVEAGTSDHGNALDQGSILHPRTTGGVS